MSFYRTLSPYSELSGPKLQAETYTFSPTPLMEGASPRIAVKHCADTNIIAAALTKLLPSILMRTLLCIMVMHVYRRQLALNNVVPTDSKISTSGLHDSLLSMYLENAQ